MKELDAVILKLQPGDVLGICSDVPITVEQAHRIEAAVTPRLPSGVACLVFNKGMKPVIIRKEEDIQESW